MKVGEYEKFDENCAIARVKNQVSSETFYVVCAETMGWKEDGLGKVVSKGKTRDEALVNAIKFFVKRQVEFEKKYCEPSDEDENPENVHNFMSNVHNLLHKVLFKIGEISLCNNEDVILPIQAWTWNEEQGYHDDKGKFWNAYIGFDENEKCVEFNP